MSKEEILELEYKELREQIKMEGTKRSSFCLQAVLLIGGALALSVKTKNFLISCAAPVIALILLIYVFSSYRAHISLVNALIKNVNAQNENATYKLWDIYSKKEEFFV